MPPHAEAWGYSHAKPQRNSQRTRRNRNQKAEAEMNKAWSRKTNIVNDVFIRLSTFVIVITHPFIPSF
ncbi:MAG: hypothetical protein A2X61_16530 [Ignavibacteria bacterium GWB2_35_12]|nr:MAG: hypothetical protein A2X61_16530 [Ignavibacteria bacterium GWB2_35_12]